MPAPLALHLLAVAALVGTGRRQVGIVPALPPGGSIRGRVELRGVPPPVEPRLAVSDLGMPAPRDLPDRRRSVVYLETAPRGAFEDAERPRATLDQRNQTFVPYVLAVIVGTTVDFPNNDRTYHNVFSFSKTRRFDLGRYGRGQSKSLRFDEPGVVRVFCEIHSHMSAFVLVFAHRYFAVTDAEGRYHIDDVPPGTYTVVAWTDGEARQSRAVRVPEGGGPVELDFAPN
jgi:plastocyanin